MNERSLQRTLLLWGSLTGAVVAGLMVRVDASLAWYFNGHRDTSWVGVFAAITDFANGFIWFSVAALGVAAAALRHRVLARIPNLPRMRQESRAWFFMAISMATSGLLINAMKFAIGRERPRFMFEDGNADFNPFAQAIADSSFPSGHTQSIWTAMLALSFLFPPLRIPFILIATTIGSSRVIVGAHYLSDVVASIFIAFATVLLWRSWFQKHGTSVTLWVRKNSEGS